MEEIIKKIIEIDNNSKAIIDLEKVKQENIEDVVMQEFNTRKTIIDMKYKDEISKQREVKDAEFVLKKQEIDNKINQEIEELKNSYNEKKETIINSIVISIKNGEE